MREELKSGIFWRFLAGYLILMLFLAGAFGLAYNQVSRILATQLDNSHRQYLRQTRIVVDQAIRNAQSVLDQLQVDPSVARLSRIASLTAGSARFYDLYRAYADLPPYNLTSDLILEYYVYYTSTGIVLSPDSAFLEDPDRIHPGSTFSIPGLDFVAMAGRSGIQSRDSFVAKDDRVYLVRPLPGSSSSAEAVIVVVLDSRRISRYLDALEIGDDGFAAIMDDTGTIIAGQRDANLDPRDVAAMQSTDFVITEERSSLTEWRYVTAVPYSVVYAQAISLRSILIGILGSFVVAGIALSAFMALRRTQPLSLLLKNLRSTGRTASHGSDSLDSLSAEVNEIVTEYGELLATTREHEQLLVSSFVSRLFLGDFMNARELESTFQIVGRPPMPQPYSAVIVEWRSMEDDDTDDNELVSERRGLSLVWRSVLQHAFRAGYVYSHQLSIDRLGILICGIEKDDVVARLSDIVDDRTRGSLTKSSGLVYVGQSHALREIGGLFSETQYFASMDDRERLVVLADSSVQVDRVMRYTMERELTLIRLVRQGDRSGLVVQLDAIWHEVVAGQSGSDQAITVFVDMLNGTLLRAADLAGVSTETELVRFAPHETVGERYARIRAGFLAIVDTLHGERRLVNQKRDEEIRAFVRQRIGDPMFNLSDLASEFRLTDRAMYKYFTNHFGRTFATYLEDLRLDRACRLLIDSDHQIKEVSDMCGYANDRTFRRAFRKKIGVKPSDYRVAGQSSSILAAAEE